VIALIIALGLAEFAFCQQRIVHGDVKNSRTEVPVKGALVQLLKTEIQVFTDSLGVFSINVPKDHRSIMITHDDYKPVTIFFNKPGYWNHPVHLKMAPVLSKQMDIHYADSVFRIHKNVLTVLPFELITGSLGVQYERFFKVRHSFGLHSSVYLFGWGYSFHTEGGANNKFTGFRISPFYRFYSHGAGSTRFFVEGKFITGYFDMHPLLYRINVGDWFELDYIAVKKNLSFWSCGAGIALGWAIKMPTFSYGIFNLSIGLQYFPLLAPRSVDAQYDHYYNSYELNETWWYLGGPGSIIQVKLAYGWLF
jgi:hypothetical protein